MGCTVIAGDCGELEQVVKVVPRCGNDDVLPRRNHCSPYL